MTWFLDKAFLAKLDLSAYDPAAIARVTGVTVEVAAAFVDPRRKYWVKTNPDYGWLTGANGDGKPTLLFVGRPRLSAEGSQAPINAVCTDHQTGVITTHAIALEGELDWDGVLDAAEDAIGFRPMENAPMLPFKHPELWHYAIVPFPFHLHDDVCKGTDDPTMAREWIARGNFVLHCGNAYDMSAEGDVASS